MMRRIVVFRDPRNPRLNPGVISKWCLVYGIPLEFHDWGGEPNYDEMTHVLDRGQPSVVIMNQFSICKIVEQSKMRRRWAGWHQHHFHSYSNWMDTQAMWMDIYWGTIEWPGPWPKERRDLFERQLKHLDIQIPIWLPFHFTGGGLLKRSNERQPVINTGLGISSASGISSEVWDTPPFVDTHPAGSGVKPSKDFLFLVRRTPDVDVSYSKWRNFFIDRVMERFGSHSEHTDTVREYVFNNDLSHLWSDAVITGDKRFQGPFNVRCDLYARCNFELVCEAHADLDADPVWSPARLYWLSEKMWKPILMRKPWLVFHQPGFLRYMRRLGFRTFHNHCDESYDEIVGPESRIQRLCDSVGDVLRSGSHQFAQNTKQICHHNRQRYLVLRAENECHQFRQLDRFIRPQLSQ